MNSIVKPLVTLLATAGLLLAGCGSDDSTSESTTSGPSGTSTDAPNVEGSITVSAAASLTEAFTKIGEDFTAANPDARATFNFDSSSILSDQILAGAPADVYASADEANMTKLTEADRIDGEPVVFARNQLVIVTKPGNPEGIEGLADLAGAGVISLCGGDAPCAKFAQQVLDGADVSIPESRVTRGQNAKATLTAVTNGDAVAGIVYVTDARGAGDSAEAVDIPPEDNAIATYPIGVLSDSADAEVAAAFMAYVLSDEVQAVLEGFGFLPPQ